MKDSHKLLLSLGAILILSLSPPRQVEGALIIDFSQVGPNVVITASGEVDTLGASFVDSVVIDASDIRNQSGTPLADRIFHLKINDDGYMIAPSGQLFASASPFVHTADSSSGDSFGLYAAGDNFLIYFPDGFSSGTIQGSMTFNNLDLASVAPIRQTISWGPGPNQSVSVVPEPSTWALLGFSGAALAGFSIFRSSRRADN